MSPEPANRLGRPEGGVFVSPWAGPIVERAASGTLAINAPSRRALAGTSRRGHHGAMPSGLREVLRTDR